MNALKQLRIGNRLAAHPGKWRRVRQQCGRERSQRERGRPMAGIFAESGERHSRFAELWIQAVQCHVSRRHSCTVKR